MMNDNNNIYPQENKSFATLQSYTPPKEAEPLLARIVSIILHPLFMGIYTVALLFVYTDFNLLFAGQFFLFMSPMFFLTCVVPLCSLYFLNKMKLIKNYGTTEPQERLIPFLVFFLSYGLLVYHFHSAKLYTWFTALLAAPLILIVVSGIISHFWKISLHMVGIGALVGSTLSVCYHVKGVNPYVLFIILFILAGCLGVARLASKKNTPAQVYAGFVLGAAVSYICVWIGAYWGLIVFLQNQ
ncbi:hypothetical protein [Dysgonomonas sp. 511]|uniref:hypothetical protein n=1 Tax=Dysgonomonas sp. 511 TaxID=2302930 RepID=UPI0013D0D72A|nr:hypothetical protein [Dysgonomonas sp. 511]NDV77949.1 hypothetical protein [Dysgonomonas sp. 511]